MARLDVSWSSLGSVQTRLRARALASVDLGGGLLAAVGNRWILCRGLCLVSGIHFWRGGAG